jgi:hypothetical protein
MQLLRHEASLRASSDDWACAGIGRASR